MARSKQTSQKTEKEKNKKRKRKEKEEKAAFRKANSNKGKGFDSMIAYVDENGHLSSTPPDTRLKTEIKVEDIQLGARQNDLRNDADGLRRGRVSLYNSEKGYGFIKDNITKEKYFFHLSNVITPVKQGDLVAYDIIKGPKGINAVGVKLQ